MRRAVCIAKGRGRVAPRLRLAALALVSASALALASQQLPYLQAPLAGKLLLSGNFGELRRNHFHSGVDFKTGGRTGLPVVAVDDGYVSRVVVSPWGFGRAVYVDHPATGLTTVYGHLEAFAPDIDRRAREEQYAREQFALDLSFAPGEIPVARGQRIGLSGNAGSSGGPHLHFDVRDTASENPLDPLEYYKDRVTDDVAPEVRSIGLYPEPDGAVDSRQAPAYRSGKTLAQPFTAWGRVVPSIKAYDRMTGTQNIYGVKHLSLTVDGREVYRRDISRFSFDDTRAVNTLVDFVGVVRDNSWNMLTYVPASCPLGEMVKADNQGVLTIDEERDYRCRWRLEDAHGNVRTVPFTIRGRRQTLPAASSERGILFAYASDNAYVGLDGFRVDVPAGALYDDLRFNASTSGGNGNFRSNVYTIGDPAVPLAKRIDISLPIISSDASEAGRYTIVRLGGKAPAAVATKVDGGMASASVDRFGRYAVTVDTIAPTITPLQQPSWGANSTVRLRVADNLSGVDTFRGEIDSRFALFELDGKSGTLSFRMDPARFQRGKTHTLRLSVSDACGNLREFSTTFVW